MKLVTSVLLFASLIMSGAAIAEVKIGGNNSQKVIIENGAVANTSVGAASSAKQNLCLKQRARSPISGNNSQQVNVKNGAVANTAVGAASKAEQNLASNDGTN